MDVNNSIPDRGIVFKCSGPPPHLTAFVESFWMLENTSDVAHEAIVLPDGRFDIIFSYSNNEPFNAMLMGLGTEAEQQSIPPKMVMFAISFKLLAIEYLLELKAASIPNNAYALPTDFWKIKKSDLNHFENFCDKVSEQMSLKIKPNIDSRKMKLFNLIYLSNGSVPVKKLSTEVFWSSRQINRYFNEQFGISLKTYCNILRFKSSLYYIKQGKLFPELNFADQNHFIREVKRMSGVTPKELSKNKNDRFILLSAL